MARLLCIAAMLLVSACASVPQALERGGPYAVTMPLEAQSGKLEGKRVRWGGIIIQTLPQTGRTCFEVMGQTLDSRAAPEASDDSAGRFIACAQGFYEPAVYAAGRAVTFTGTVEGTEQQKVGEYLYEFPRLAADAVYLWPKRREVIYVPYYDPFWDPFWPYHYRPYRYH